MVLWKQWLLSSSVSKIMRSNMVTAINRKVLNVWNEKYEVYFWGLRFTVSPFVYKSGYMNGGVDDGGGI